jgi:transposase
MSEVAKDYGVAWWTVHRILVATAVQALGQAAPTSMIGIDETRARSVRWFFKETSWRRSDPWMTSIVDLDPTRPAGIIGLAPGRSGACVEAWISAQSKEFRDGVTVVAIDPSAPYASGIRRALPQARIVLDHFHLVMLGRVLRWPFRNQDNYERRIMLHSAARRAA